MHLKYLSYVVRHKWFVYLAGRKLGVSFWQLLKHDWTKFLPSEWTPYVLSFNYNIGVGDKVFIHSMEGYGGPGIVTEVLSEGRYRVDLPSAGWSKPGICWDHEVLKVNQRTGKIVNDDFDAAWNYHQKRNKHHWQYWYLVNDNEEPRCVEMPEKYAREMVADWAGAGRAITGRWEVATWYQANRDKIKLHVRTRDFVEALLRYGLDGLTK